MQTVNRIVPTTVVKLWPFSSRCHFSNTCLWTHSELCCCCIWSELPVVWLLGLAQPALLTSPCIWTCWSQGAHSVVVLGRHTACRGGEGRGGGGEKVELVCEEVRARFSRECGKVRVQLGGVGVRRDAWYQQAGRSN